jgi:hypothetical protein
VGLERTKLVGSEPDRIDPCARNEAARGPIQHNLLMVSLTASVDPFRNEVISAPPRAAMRLALALVEVEQFARARQSVDVPANRGLVEVQSAVTRADLGDEIDVPHLLGVCHGVGREPLRLADRVGLRVVVLLLLAS